MDSIYLHGSEDVRSAASAMVRAADEMQRAASSMDNTFSRQQAFLDDWLMRLEAVLTRPNTIRQGEEEI